MSEIIESIEGSLREFRDCREFSVASELSKRALDYLARILDALDLIGECRDCGFLSMLLQISKQS